MLLLRLIVSDGVAATDLNSEDLFAIATGLVGLYELLVGVGVGLE